MTSRDCIKEMFVLQQKLNDETNGIGWEKGYTKNNRLINWKRCIYMESAELIDSFNWKHWKDINKETDWENAKIELVDIWHFIMSLALEDYTNEKHGDIDKLVDDVINVQGFERFTKEPYGVDSAEPFEIINDIEGIINITTSFNMDLFDGLFKEYFGLCLKCGVNMKVLYIFYIAKNVLNRFRQDNGYKEGTYKKNWEGLEDNEVMLALLEQRPYGADELYDALSEKYAKVS